MINFTVGPVQSKKSIRDIGAEQVPYFRTEDFSQIMFENEMYMKQCVNADESARTIFITGSGTASMEATVINCLCEEDKVLVVKGGTFGQRFVQLCERYNIPYSEIVVEYGKTLTIEQLNAYDSKGYTAFLVNAHETSVGLYYDLNMIGEFCNKNNLFLIVDAISSFLADPFDMKKMRVDVMITGSQKALACPPGISIIVLSENAVNRINNNCVQSIYFDLKVALRDAERGQTPFTPAVGILLQIHQRLQEIVQDGGVDAEINHVRRLAQQFRDGIKDLPLEIASPAMSNAVTPVHPINISAYDIFLTLKDEYHIWVCPNGGNLADVIFRVGHIGDLSISDNEMLIEALKDMYRKGKL